MRKKNKNITNIGIIGHIADGTDINDGQTVKIRMIRKELEKEKKYNIDIVDTYGWRNKKIKTLFKILKLCIHNKKIVLSVARKGGIVIIPILIINKYIFGNQICYCSIGGWLSQHIENHKIFKKCCKRLDKIFVETQDTKKRLERQGYNNVEQLYNFKIFNNKDIKNFKPQENSFCIFSRILKEKGIEDAISVVENLHNKGYNLKLDIYGPIEDRYNERFQEIKETFPDYIKYCGNVKPENSIEVLKNYFMLLFPTKYITEGLPGTLIDAYSSGVPVLASNWNSADEFVIEKEIGYIYDFDDIEDFEKKLKYILDNKDEILNMRKNCLEYSKRFQPGKAIEPLTRFINN